MKRRREIPGQRLEMAVATFADANHTPYEFMAEALHVRPPGDFWKVWIP